MTGEEDVDEDGESVLCLRPRGTSKAKFRGTLLDRALGVVEAALPIEYSQSDWWQQTGSKNTAEGHSDHNKRGGFRQHAIPIRVRQQS
jgi:hypothetical protein